MNSRDVLNSPRTSLAGTVLAPGLLLLVVRLLVGGPAPSPAATPLAPAPAFPMAALTAAKPPLPPAQAKALQWITTRELASAKERRSPMESPPPPPKVATPTTPDEPVKPAARVDERDPLDAVKISAIMGTGDTGLVSVAGTFLRLGDEIAHGWHISTIDGKNRLIVVSHAKKPDRTIRLEP